MEDVPILYINLDRSKERKIRMEEQFKRYNIKNYKRVPAFDGRKLFSDSSLRAKTVELPKDMKQSSGEIGCSLSHLRAAEMALEIDAPYVLVMEDDIHLTFYERRAAPRFTKVPSTRLHETRSWVVSFFILSCFGPRRGRRGVSETEPRCPAQVEDVHRRDRLASAEGLAGFTINDQ